MTNTKTLAIYGNYLSDLDQASTLKNLGASLLKTSHTAASYRLFSSEDTQAVLCEDATDGRQIRVELWQVSEALLLKLIDESPPAFYLEKLKLSDGTDSLVFIVALEDCLADGYVTEGYEEVSRFGGWERYLLKKAEQEA